MTTKLEALPGLVPYKRPLKLYCPPFPHFAGKGITQHLEYTADIRKTKEFDFVLEAKDGCIYGNATEMPLGLSISGIDTVLLELHQKPISDSEVGLLIDYIRRAKAFGAEQYGHVEFPPMV